VFPDPPSPLAANLPSATVTRFPADSLKCQLCPKVKPQKDETAFKVRQRFARARFVTFWGKNHPLFFSRFVTFWKKLILIFSQVHTMTMHFEL
jgi:hypothetical protein